MNERLREFVRMMSENPQRASEFSKNPSIELDRSNLSDEEKRILLTRDSDLVKKAIADINDPDPNLQMNAFFKHKEKEKEREKEGGGKPGVGRPRPRVVRRKKVKAAKKAKKTKKPTRPRGKGTARKSARKGSKRRR